MEEKVMKRKVGLWIDHRQAIVVAITDKGEQTALVISRVERQPRRSDKENSSGKYESQMVHSDDSQQRVMTHHLNDYYDSVIASLRNAESILILGPGEAKGELKKRLKKVNLADRIVGVETFDKLTHRQVAAIVRERFAQ
jgi:stalled ribosome rescue protein Dom34